MNVPIFIGPRSNHSLPMALLKPSWSQSFSKMLHGFLQVDTRICQDCCVDLSRLPHVFLALCQTKASRSLKVSSSCHMDWSKLLYVPRTLCQTKPSRSLIEVFQSSLQWGNDCVRWKKRGCVIFQIVYLYKAVYARVCSAFGTLLILWYCDIVIVCRGCLIG